MKKTIGIAATLAILICGYAWVNSQNSPQVTKPAVDYTSLGNKLICPVMREEFNVNKETPKAEYKGKVYFFCCPACVEKFNKEPEKYLSAAAPAKDAKMRADCKCGEGMKAGKHKCGDCAGKSDKAGHKDCPMMDMNSDVKEAPAKKN
ncbi:MAG: hypothetical protein COT17_01875 [Elusimicrobia bacterium CG08_land_8_20_14_0_20_51_18]|nr:MAG: hypothetical protein COT17_01875 [Elusimicrobia bacterium CG08_land_8_20_14_0_20_51_18]